MRWVTLRIYRNQGGVLKGQIAPGDAHPYLGLFDGQKNTEGINERQQGVCTICGQHFEIGEMEVDHKKQAIILPNGYSK